MLRDTDASNNSEVFKKEKKIMFLEGRKSLSCGRGPTGSTWNGAGQREGGHAAFGIKYTQSVDRE